MLVQETMMFCSYTEASRGNQVAPDGMFNTSSKAVGGLSELQWPKGRTEYDNAGIISASL